MANLNKSERPTGTTHAAHEARHLARKMQDVRDGKKSKEELEAYLVKLKNEHEVLVSRFKDCWAYLENRESRVLNVEIPVLTKEQAEKRDYMKGYEVSDFGYVSRVEMSLEYGGQFAPQKEHVGPCAMLLQAAIYDLAWAIAEIQTYLKP